MVDIEKPLSVGEFTRWSSTVDETLKMIRADQQDHGERLARIEGTNAERERTELLRSLNAGAKREEKSRFKLSAATWTTGVSSFIAMLGYALQKFGLMPGWLERLFKS